MAVERRLRTNLVHGGVDRSPHGETAEALYLTSGFCYENAEEAAARFADTRPGFTYSRVGNPTVRMFEERMALVEGAETAIACASGMAAVHAVLFSELRAGMRVVAAAPLFGSCHWILTELLPRFGVHSELVRAGDVEAWRRALLEPTDIVFIESPANPTLELVDIELVAELAHAAGAKLVVDNVLGTPVQQHPLRLGADIVLYSATKHIDGQGRCLGGVILCDRERRRSKLEPYLKNTGASLSPFNAWVLVKGLETLDLRVRAQARTAFEVAEYLSGQSGVDWLSYPGLPSHPQHELARRQMSGFGTVLAFRTGGGRERAFEVLDRCRLVMISNNLGDAKTLATHPASTTHAKMPTADREAFGITEDLIRISIGLEDPADLIADLDQALAG